MQHFLVNVWVGGGDNRWNTQSVDLIATSPSEATRFVAEDLCLPAGSWQGENPPFELIVLPLEDTPLVVETPAESGGSDRWLAVLKAQYNHFLGHTLGHGRHPVPSIG